MCGIFGGIVGHESAFRHASSGRRNLKALFRLSSSRGKEAAGLAFAKPEELVVYKSPVPATEFMHSPAFRDLVDSTLNGGSTDNGDGNRNELAFIGHSRLVTDGLRENNDNNQPVIVDGVVGIHNGIIVNHDKLWEKYELERRYEVDSEIIFALLDYWLGQGASMAQAARSTFRELEGAASVAALFSGHDRLLMATNNGSLYYRAIPEDGTLVFASESYILKQFSQNNTLNTRLAEAQTVAVRPGEGVVVDLATGAVEPFDFERNAEPRSPAMSRRETGRRVVDRSVESSPPGPRREREEAYFARLAEQFPHRPMSDLKRCSRCILPATMPFVDFDADGVCSYCRNHRPTRFRDRAELEALVEPYRRSDGSPDCVLGVSGGRDSLFALHWLKTELKMNPVAYTYDWGMVTDLARRNISRMCGKLGIEHLLVSADITTKRRSIRKNVAAWLEKPSLGTIPLFMAGDKAYFHFLNQVRAQLDTPLAFLGENLLERSDFKIGYANARPASSIEGHVFSGGDGQYALSTGSKVRLAAYYLRHFISNPAFLNSSLWDTGKAFVFYYMVKREYYNLYSFIPWEEDVVVPTLLNDYNFELAEDTDTTWRIGDGTAAFYNYIYYTVAGLTENDTFRSNQIRDGVITRDDALARVEQENRPRFPSIQWYLDTIGLDQDLEQVLATIHRIPKRPPLEA